MTRLNKQQVLRLVASEVGLTNFQLDGDTLVVGEGPVKHALEVSHDKHKPSLLAWTVLAFDELVDPLLLRFGGVRIEIWRPDRFHEVSGVRSPVGYRYPWPSSAEALLKSELIADAKKHALSAASFVSDRRDLADLLLSDRDVHRGDVWAHLPVGARPSRLVKAIVLGRVASDSIIEQKAIEVLEREGDQDISWEPDRPYLFRQFAGDWAKKYGAASGVDLSDVIRNGRRRR